MNVPRLEEKKVLLEEKPFTVKVMCEECLQMVRHLAEKKSLQLRVDCDECEPIHVSGDANRLKQALIKCVSLCVITRCHRLQVFFP